MADKARIAGVFKDFKVRRAAIIKALTQEADKFFQQCDPKNENLSLYGLPNGTWEVSIPDEEVPPELPEPGLGINFARDGMECKAWLFFVAVYSGSLQIINDLPTIYDVVNMEVNPEKAQSYRTKSRKKQPLKAEQPKAVTRPKEEDEREAEGGEDGTKQSATLCASCNIDYADEEFCILCDIHQKWYHGKCVSVTPAKAANIKDYVCPEIWKLVR